jgi:sec-independent protein translocase protein TatB
MIPGAGGLEYVLIAILALVIVGPKDLPILLRKMGKWTGKVRNMANEFRASFDEMARQSELDELRQEVEALRTQQIVQPLGPDLENHFREIRGDLQDLPTASTTPMVSLSPDSPMLSSPMIGDAGTRRPDVKRAAKKPAKPKAKAAPKSTAKAPAAPKKRAVAKGPAKTKTPARKTPAKKLKS